MEFDKEQHIYTRQGYRYTSASKIVEMFSPEFDSERIAGYVAKKEKKDVRDVLDVWTMKRDISINYGNAIHYAIELWIKHNEKPNNDYLCKVIDTFPIKRTGLESETIVYDDTHRLAGTIDILRKKKNKWDIYDIKTSYDLEKSYKSLLSPFNDLKDSSLNKYRLQLTLYKYMVEKMGREIDKMYLLKWSDKWEKIELEPIKIDIEQVVKNVGVKKVGEDIINLSNF